MAKLSFNNRNNVFFQSLKSSAEQYFKDNHLNRTGNWKLYSKTIILISTAIVIYASLLFLKMPVLWGILLSSLFGFILACIGFNVMHDANHGSYSSKKWVNSLFGYSLNALGGNAYIWKFKHNILHHTYTNVDGLDDDIAKSPLMRQCTSQKWVPAHRFQHIYVIMVYAISSFAWIFLMDFDKYFKQKIYTTPIQKISTGEHIIFWLTKTLYVLFYIVIPVIFVGWQAWAIGFTLLHIFMGSTLAIVFQLAHVVEDTEFEFSGMDDKIIESEWAVHEVKSTANFAPRNKIITWLVGGLNFQIEHHLFPRVSHIHYPALSKIVAAKCKEFDIPYRTFPTMTAAMISHFKTMKQLGASPDGLNNMAAGA
jgi:linoleoyl-CoA desaturase